MIYLGRESLYSVRLKKQINQTNQFQCVSFFLTLFFPPICTSPLLCMKQCEMQDGDAGWRGIRLR